MSIPGLPQDAVHQLGQQAGIERVVLYDSRALHRHHSGSDVALCLEAPELTLNDLLVLGCQLADLMLPMRIDLQLAHLIEHDALLEHIRRVGVVLWSRTAKSGPNHEKRD